LEASIRGFGLDAPHVAMSCNNLAEVMRVQGKLEQAIELYKQAVEVFQVHYTLEDPRTATTYYNLATALYLSGRFSDAKIAADKGFEGMKGVVLKRLRRRSQKLVDVLVEKQAFFEAMKICTAAETSLKRLELIESLSFASIRRKEALVHLKDPQV